MMEPEGLSLEFLNLAELPALDATRADMASCYVSLGKNSSKGLEYIRELVNRINEKTIDLPRLIRNEPKRDASTVRMQDYASKRNMRHQVVSHQKTPGILPTVVPREVRIPTQPIKADMALFASQGTMGVVDMGATKTVIGSELVPEMLAGLDPEIRKKVGRCKCTVTFRFGNQSTLGSQYALVLPVGKLQLKVAVVPGATPFLLSNTLLRALRAIVDTENRQIVSRVLDRKIPMHLTSNGLVLLDVNDLCRSTPANSPSEQQVQETFSACEVKSRSDVVPGVMTGPQVGEQADSQPEKSTEESHDEIHAATHGPSSSSPQVPVKHVVWSPKPQSAAAQSSRRHDQRYRRVRGADQSSHLDRPGGHADQLREKAQGQDLLASLGGSRLCGLVHELDGEQSATRASLVSQVHRAEGRRDRGSTSGGRDPIRTSSQDKLDRSWISVDASSPAEVSRCDGFSHSGEERTGRERDQQHVGRDGGITRAAVGCPRPAESHVGNGECLAGDTHGHHKDIETTNMPLEKTHVQSMSQSAVTGYPSAPSPATDTGQRSITEAPQMPGDQLNSERSEMVDEWSHWMSAGEVDELGDPVNFSEEADLNSINKKLRELIRRFQKEFDDANQSLDRNKTQLDLLEIFAEPQSQLTRQCQALGLHARRLGRSEGDLETSEGRQLVWQHLIQQKPRHVWFSPTCSPWSAWSRFNESRSLSHAREMQLERIARLPQVALGIIVARQQHAEGRHFHWEQPGGSAMFMLAPMQEPLAYLHRVKFDMCVAGDLRDPKNILPIRKRLQLLTSSPGMKQWLQDRFCRGQHETHQMLEGQTMVEGHSISRTLYSQSYPRKFARQAAAIIKQVESIILTSEALAVKRHLDSRETPDPKRSRIRPTMQVPPTGALAEWQSLKRRRIERKQERQPQWSDWHEVFQQLDQLIPRVGKMNITDQPMAELWKTQFKNMDILHLVACRGTDRMLLPPDELKGTTQLSRRLIYLDRSDGQIKGELSWEMIANRPKNQLIRRGPSCRIGVTAFATPKNTAPPNTTDTEQPTEEPRAPTNEPQHTQLPPEEEHEASQQQYLGRLSPQERTALLRAHKNLGHPEPSKLAALLQQQQFRPDIVKSAYELKCPTCQANQAPKKPRPAAFKEARDFNDRVSVDGLTWTNRHGQAFHIYHFIDHATNFHVGCVSPEQTTEAFLEKFCERWLSWAGAPGEILVDSGTEFNSERFAGFCQEHDLKCTVTSHEAAWQNAKCERHGGILKHMLNKFAMEHDVENSRQLEIAIAMCTQAKNATGLKGGYAPRPWCWASRLAWPHL